MEQITEQADWEPLIVEDALRSLPLQTAPPALYPAVMRQIRARAARPSFQVSWLDLTLSLFAACMAGLIWLVLRSLPPEMRLELAWLGHWLAFLNAWWALAAGLLIVAVLGGLFALAQSMPRQPRLVRR